MERETNFLHVLQSHQMTLLIIGSVVVLGSVLLLGVWIGRRQEKHKKAKNDQVV